MIRSVKASNNDLDAITVRPAEAAQRLRMSRAALYRLLQDGTIPSRRVGGIRLIAVSALQEFGEAAD